MQRSLKTCFATALLNQAAEALKVFTKEDDTCDDVPEGWTTSGSFNAAEGTTYENMIITCEPDTDICVKVGRDDVTFRNVIIYHPANGMGLYGWDADNLLLENVQVIAYGNEWGASPCPDRSPQNGYRCANIELKWSDNLVIRNVETDSGSTGISIYHSPNASLSNVVAKNVRGPYPAGQCFQIDESHGAILEDFHCYNDAQVAWTEDAISMYQSAGVMVRRGTVDGGNSMTGQSVMFEGSSHESIGGYVDDVEVINAQGCFGYYPQKGIYQTNSVCASPVCASDNPPRGAKEWTNLWTAGANTAKSVEYLSESIYVTSSYVYDVCDADEMSIKWEAEEGMMYTTFEVDELEEFTPRTPPSANLPWDAECWRPTATCADFIQEWMGGDQSFRRRFTDDAKTYEALQGSCYGNKAWNDGLSSQDPDQRVL